MLFRYRFVNVLLVSRRMMLDAKRRRLMSETRPRGALIVFEGGDGCGKTTHSARLTEALRKDGRDVELIKFPARGTPTGHLINEYLKQQQNLEEHATHLLFAANRWELMPEMRRKLDMGVTLIADRYCYSGVAYSVAKQIEGMDMEWCWQSEVGLIRPDAVFLLAIDPETMSERLKSSTGERFDDVSFQFHVQENFNSMVTSTWTRIDTSRDADEVHAEIKAVVGGILENLSPEITFLR